jgi:hypothetical protein
MSRKLKVKSRKSNNLWFWASHLRLNCLFQSKTQASRTYGTVQRGFWLEKNNIAQKGLRHIALSAVAGRPGV